MDEREETNMHELPIGQVVLYTGSYGEHTCEVVANVDCGEQGIRYNLRTIPAFRRNGQVIESGRYRHNGVGPALPLQLSFAGRGSVTVITGLNITDLDIVPV